MFAAHSDVFAEGAICCPRGTGAAETAATLSNVTIPTLFILCPRLIEQGRDAGRFTQFDVVYSSFTMMRSAMAAQWLTQNGSAASASLLVTIFVGLS